MTNIYDSERNKAPVTSGLRPCYDLCTTTKEDESQINCWNIAQLILKVKGDTWANLVVEWSVVMFKTLDLRLKLQAANISHMIARPIVQGCNVTIRGTWSGADTSALFRLKTNKKSWLRITGPLWSKDNMMTSSNGNIFRVLEPLLGEPTAHR